MLGALVFGLCMVAVASIVVLSVRGSVEDHLRSRITLEAAQLLGDYADDGMDELRHDIRERIKRQSSDRLYYAVTNAEGRSIFDAIPHVPQEGWHTKTAATGEKLIVHTYALSDGYWLSIAADTHTLSALEEALRHTFALVFIVMAVLSALAGALVSRKFLRQVERLQHSAERIGRDSITARIPLRGVDDEFDALALTINHMLDRIETLMRDVRYVSTSIAHDLRTPLGVLRQKLEVLDAKADTAEMQALTAASIAQLDSTLDTFSSLLKISEIESQPNKNGYERVDLAALLTQLTEVYAPIAEEKHQKLTLAIPHRLEAVQGDKKLLTQFFVNLIENAINHTPDGTAIHIVAIMHEGKVTVHITDNGPGIDPGEYGNIFKPFYKMDSSRAGKGNGLGLSLVAAIAKRHNITIILRDHAPGLIVECVFM